MITTKCQVTFEAMTFGGSYAGDRPDFSITATQIAGTAFASSQT